MAVTKASISPDIRKRLGPRTLEQVLASLYPVDCQACGRPLDGVPALVVDDLGVTSTAQLTHPRCRASEWNAGPLLPTAPDAHLTWTGMNLLLPMERDGDVEMRPLLLVNPGLEMVFLDHDGHGGRHIRLPVSFQTAGMVTPGPMLRIEQPIDGAVVRLAHGEVAVTLTESPPRTFAVNADPQFLAHARQAGGVLFAATYAVNPHEIRELRDLEPVLAGDRTLMGWVELAQLREQRPSPQQPPGPTQTFVLHHSGQHLSVGVLLAHTAEPMNVADAQRWARHVIGENQTDHLMDWEPTSVGDPAAGWSIMNFINGEDYLLRRYPDGWRLVQAFSRAEGPVGIETDNEMRAWAAAHVQRKTGTRGVHWQPGPAPDGATTLYGQP